MPLKAANFATATDAQIIMMYLALSALTGGLGGTVYNAPADLTPFQLDVLRPLLLTELYRRGGLVVAAINALP